MARNELPWSRKTKMRAAVKRDSRGGAFTMAGRHAAFGGAKRGGAGHSTAGRKGEPVPWGGRDARARARAQGRLFEVSHTAAKYTYMYYMEHISTSALLSLELQTALLLFVRELFRLRAPSVPRFPGCPPAYRLPLTTPPHTPRPPQSGSLTILTLSPSAAGGAGGFPRRACQRVAQRGAVPGEARRKLPRPIAK